MGTYDATIEADYPMVVSRSLGDRRAGVADQLLGRLRSPSAVELLVERGFRPPAGTRQARPRSPTPAGFPTTRAPIALPDAAGWHRLVDGWVRTG
jgi:hypothetical protein